jgi:hypothetical protein
MNASGMRRRDWAVLVVIVILFVILFVYPALLTVGIIR